MPDGPSGGIVTVLRALASLTELEDGGNEYVFIGPYEDPEWMRPMLAPGTAIVRGPEFMSPLGWRPDPLEPFKRRLGPLRPIASEVKRLLAPQQQAMAPTVSLESRSRLRFGPATSRGFFHSLGCDVVHFPFQSFEACGIPSVYNPHDLQHVHLPEFFKPEEISRRETLYSRACGAANTVVVASHFVKRDVVRRYGLESNKVQVISWAPPAALPNP